MRKKIVSLLLTAALAISMLAGCGGNSEDTGYNPAATGTEQGDANQDASVEEAEAAEIVVALMCFTPLDQAVQDRIEADINEKMSEMINVTADFQWYDATTY